MGMSSESSSMSVYCTLGSVTMLMTWFLPTLCHQIAGRHMIVTFVCQSMSWCKAQFFSLLEDLNKEGVGTRNLIITHEDDATIYRSNEVDVKMMLQATDAFCQEAGQALFFPFSIVIQACLSLFAGCATSSPLACRMFCLFPFWIHGGGRADYAIKGAFLSLRNFSIWWPIRLQSSW